MLLRIDDLARLDSRIASLDEQVATTSQRIRATGANMSAHDEAMASAPTVSQCILVSPTEPTARRLAPSTTSTQGAACTPRDSFVWISFNSNVTSNLGGLGDGTEQQTPAGIPRGLYYRNVGTTNGVPIDLRVSNQTEYRSFGDK